MYILFLSCCFVIFLLAVRCQADVTLTCPETWYNGETVTLYCEVVKASIASKCTDAAPESTNFNLDPGTGISTSICFVGPKEYSSCDYTLGTTPLGCGCQGNSTHYTFVYQRTADKTRDNGSWECIKACIQPVTNTNPLTTTTSSSCNNVNVVDRGEIYYIYIM